MDKFFGTDGIRGTVGKPPITADFLLKVGWAVGSVLSENGPASVIIGKDTRVSGYLFESALEAGFLSAGVSVGLLGPMPSPAIAYLTKAYGASAGVVISASHNNFQDNGVKFFSSQGLKLSDKTQKAIEKKISTPMVSVDSANIGKAFRHDQALGRYIEFCKSTFDRIYNLSHLTIVVDCANGATYNIAQCVFEELGAKVIMINNQPDGYNINHNCGATDTTHLQQEVLNHEADLGIAFDGDGDRLIMVDHTGEKVDGDELVFIIAKAWKKNGTLKSSTVVGTKMSNLGMREALSDLDINFIEAEKPDVVCLQEIKANPDQFDESVFHELGYKYCYWYPAEKKGYSGVAVYSKYKPEQFSSGFGDTFFDNEGRTIIVNFKEFILFNIYFPNGQRSDERLKYKLDFYNSILDKLIILKNIFISLMGKDVKKITTNQLI